MTASLVRRAAGEVYGRRFVPRWLAWFAGALAIGALAGTAFVGWRVWQQQTSPLYAPVNPPTPAARTAAAAPHPAAPAKAPAPAVSIDALLAANSANTSEAAAFRRLLSLWGSAMAEDQNPCEQATKAGLSCLDQRGS